MPKSLKELYEELPLVWCDNCGRRFVDCVSHDKPYVPCDSNPSGSVGHDWTSAGRKASEYATRTLESDTEVSNDSVGVRLQKPREESADSIFVFDGHYYCNSCGLIFDDVYEFQNWECGDYSGGGTLAGPAERILNANRRHVIYRLVAARQV